MPDVNDPRNAFKLDRETEASVRALDSTDAAVAEAEAAWAALSDLPKSFGDLDPLN